MEMQARKGGGLRFVLMALVAMVVVAVLASVLLPTTVGRVVADLWVGVMSSIGQLLGG
jgi:hypothetical protein